MPALCGEVVAVGLGYTFVALGIKMQLICHLSEKDEEGGTIFESNWRDVIYEGSWEAYLDFD